MKQRFFKVIACEIAVREINFVAAQSPHLVDVEYLTQGLHDVPCTGGPEIQRRIDAVPEGKYDAILLGYGLCGNLIKGLSARTIPLVVPRAHDCITFFLGSKERYQQMQAARLGTYYYSSGWLECLRRRGESANGDAAGFLPTRAGVALSTGDTHREWVEKYGEESAAFLMEMMDQWTQHYSHGALIEFDFTRALRLSEQVLEICQRRGWQYDEVPGDLGLLRRWVNGEWNEREFLIVPPSHTVAPRHDDMIMESIPVPEGKLMAST